MWLSEGILHSNDIHFFSFSPVRVIPPHLVKQLELRVERQEPPIEKVRIFGHKLCMCLLFTSFKAFVFVGKINRFRVHFLPDSRHAVASKTSGSLLSPMAALGRSISNIDHRSAERASARSKLRSAASRVSPQNHHAQLRQPRTQHPSRGTVSQRK